MKTVAALAGFLLTSAVAVAAHAALDEVDLVDGTVLQGRIVQQTPGSLVVIQTDDGRVQSVPWSQVKRVSAMAPPVAAAYVPAPTPPVTTAPAADAVPDAASRSTPYVPPTVHFELGARLGYMLATGSYFSGSSITAANGTAALGGTEGGVPIVVDAGMRIGKYVFLGAFTQYGLLATNCFTPGEAVTVSCSAHDVRAGVELQVHTRPRAGVDPWFGIALGHDWLTAKASGSDASSDVVQYTFDGWNLLDLTFGVDLHTSAGMGIGPYLEATSGSFDNLSSSIAGTASSGSIGSTSPHQWVTLGVRGTFEVGATAQAD